MSKYFFSVLRGPSLLDAKQVLTSTDPTLAIAAIKASVEKPKDGGTQSVVTIAQRGRVRVSWISGIKGPSTPELYQRFADLLEESGLLNVEEHAFDVSITTWPGTEFLLEAPE